MRFTIVALIATSGLLQGVRATICGLQGYDRGYDSFADSNDGTYTSCASFCSKTAMCKSFAFGGGVCHLYNRAVAGNFILDNTSPFTFFDASCPKPTTTSTRITSTTSTSKRSSTSTGISTSTRVSSRSTTTAGVTPRPTTTMMIYTTKATTTTTSTKTSSAALVNATCMLENAGTCNKFKFTTFTDPCNKGCGCTYKEMCGGAFTGGSLIEAVVGYTYSDCIRACDVHQPGCAGVEYHYARGACYLYSSYDGTSAGDSSNSANQIAVKQICNNACPSAKSCATNYNVNSGSNSVFCF